MNNNEFELYRNKVVKIVTSNNKGIYPLYGRLIAESAYFLTLEKINGQIITLHKKFVIELQLTRDQKREGSPYEVAGI
jgi:hypothetical protein